jgi:predicted nucleic acid-binding protein
VESAVVYIDACCFIDAAKIQPDDAAVRTKYSRQELEDASFIKEILTAARDGQLDAVTSALTIAECTSVEKGQANPPIEVKQLFRAMLLSNKVVSIVEPSIFICEDARDLRWDHGLLLRGADAIHLATAKYKKCAEFITTDKRILNKKKQVRDALGIDVVRPARTLRLPDDYRQQTMPWAPPPKAKKRRGRKRKEPGGS